MAYGAAFVDDITSSGNLTITSNVSITGDVSSTNALVTGNSTAGNFQTSGNINSAAGRVTGNFTTGNVLSTGNVNVAAGIITGNVSIGNVRLSTNGVITFADGSRQTTAAAGTVTSVAGQTVTISNAQLASAVSGQNLGTPSAIVLTNATGTAANLTANITNFISVVNDTTTNATFYPIFANGITGAITESVSNTKLTFNPSTGLLTSTDYNSSSDKRLKSSIETIKSALATVEALRGVTFTWNDSNTPAIGMIAQEVKEILPEIVTEDDDGYLGIKYTNMIGILVEAIKELKVEFDEYKKTHP